MAARPRLAVFDRAWRTIVLFAKHPLDAPLRDYPPCRQPRILRKTAFFIGSSVAIFASAAWYTNYETNKQWRASLPECEAVPAARCGPLTAVLPSISKRRNEQLKRAQAWCNKLCSRVPKLSEQIRSCTDLYKWSIVWSDPARFFVGLTAVQLGITFLWRIPRTKHLLARHALHAGLSGRNFTMITANFSHPTFTHLAANSVLLYSFSSSLDWIRESGGPEACWTNDIPQLLAFYTIAGMFGMFLPNVTALVLYRRQIRSLPPSASQFVPEAWRPPALGTSSGASISVIAIVTLTMLTSESATSPMVHIAGHDISWRQAFAALVAREFYLLLFTRWSSAAEHICGGLFGVFYYYAGPSLWASLRNTVGNRHTWIEPNHETGGYTAFVHDFHRQVHCPSQERL